MIKKFVKQALSAGKDVVIEVEGNCMVPIIMEGEKVLIHSIKNDEQIKVGDIVLFEDEVLNNLVLHRVNYVYKDLIITAGDNNPFFDPVMNKNKVIGKVESSDKKIEKSSANIIYVINSSLNQIKKENVYYTDRPNETIDKMKALNYSIIVIHSQAKSHLFESDFSKLNKIAYFFGYEFSNELDNHIFKFKVDSVVRTEIFPDKTNLSDQIKSVEFLHAKYNIVPFSHSN